VNNIGAASSELNFQEMKIVAEQSLACQTLGYLPALVAVSLGLHLKGYCTHIQGRRSLWDMGTCPIQYLRRGGASMVMSPNILEVMSFRMLTRVTANVICCILMQILYVVSQKKLLLVRLDKAHLCTKI